jgi:signal transduction histidine kinase
MDINNDVDHEIDEVITFVTVQKKLDKEGNKRDNEKTVLNLALKEMMDGTIATNSIKSLMERQHVNFIQTIGRYKLFLIYVISSIW